jgi:hypothetical protein
MGDPNTPISRSRAQKISHRMRIVNFALVTVMVMLSQDVFADWSTTRFFQSSASKRFTVNAKLKPPGQATFNLATDGSSAYAVADISSVAVNGSTNCGHVEAITDGANSNKRMGWAQRGWSWGEDVDALLPHYSMVPMYSKGVPAPGNPENFTAATLNDQGINYDANTRVISIKNLSGFLRVASSDLKNDYSTFQIKVATFKGEGEDAKLVRTIWSAKAMIMNGQLLLEGNFTAAEFECFSDGNDKVYTLTDISKDIVIPAGIDISTVCVRVSGDGGNLGIGIPEVYAPASPEAADLQAQMLNGTSFNFNIGQANDEMIARISNNEAKITIDEVMLMTLDGKVMASRKVSANETGEIKMSTNGLANGSYLFMLKSKDQYFSKKFILQR